MQSVSAAPRPRPLNALTTTAYPLARRLEFTQMELVKVQVPDGVKEGMVFQCQTPGGLVSVTAPPGTVQGQFMQIQVPAAVAPMIVQGMPAQAYPPMEQPTAMAQPFGFMPAPVVSVGGSQDFLTTMDGMFVRQQLELLELVSGCETKNRYSMVAIPNGTNIPPAGQMTSGFTSGLRMQADAMPLLKVRLHSPLPVVVSNPADI